MELTKSRENCCSSNNLIWCCNVKLTKFIKSWTGYLCTLSVWTFFYHWERTISLSFFDYSLTFLDEIQDELHMSDWCDVRTSAINHTDISNLSRPNRTVNTSVEKWVLSVPVLFHQKIEINLLLPFKPLFFSDRVDFLSNYFKKMSKLSQTRLAKTRTY